MESDTIGTEFVSYPESGFPAGGVSTMVVASTYPGYGASLAPPTVTADFQGDKMFRVRLEAAPGMRFRVLPPAGFQDYKFDFYLQSFSPLTPPLETGVIDSLVFEDLMGASFGSASGLFRAFLGNDEFHASFDLDLGGLDAFTFKSVMAQWPVPTAFDPVFEDRSILQSRVAFIASVNGVQPSDPGQWVFVEAVPEPSLATLLGIGFAGFAARKLR